MEAITIYRGTYITRHIPRNPLILSNEEHWKTGKKVTGMTYAVAFGYETEAIEEAQSHAFPPAKGGEGILLRMKITPDVFPLLAGRIFRLDSGTNGSLTDVPVKEFEELRRTSAVRIDGRHLKLEILAALKLDIGRENAEGGFDFIPFEQPSLFGRLFKLRRF